nr:hypothetical protein [Treponema sp.]
MNKKILILEPSVTVQKLFITMLDRNVYDLKFTSEAIDLITLMFDYEPDIVLINAELENPGSFELVKIIRTMDCFSNFPIGMYSSSKLPFDEYFSMYSGANTFVHLDEKTLMLNISELAQLSSNSSLNKVDMLLEKKDMDEKKIFNICANTLKKDMFKTVAFDRLFEMIHYWTSMEDISRAFLILFSKKSFFFMTRAFSNNTPAFSA